jgi:hypothetical protein
MSAPAFPDVYADRVKTMLQMDGLVFLAEGATLGELLGLVDALGIDPNEVAVTRGGARQLKLTVTK